MGIRVRLCSDWCLMEADDSSDYPQTSVSCIVRTQYPYFAQRYAGITGFGPILLLLLNCYFYCPGADTGPEPEEELLPFPLPDGPPDETFPEPAPVGVVELLPG